MHTQIVYAYIEQLVTNMSYISLSIWMKYTYIHTVCPIVILVIAL